MRKITNEELGRPSAEEFAAMEKMPVTVVLDNVRSAQNVGAFSARATLSPWSGSSCAASPPLRPAVTSTKRLWGPR